MSLMCPECEEDAVQQAPTVDLTPQLRDNPPSCCHADGTPLCPVMGEGGYVPAEAVERG
jgi:hypothetical protein